MAAFRAGINTVIIPEENVPDLDEIDQTVRAALRFVPVSHMDQVLPEILASSPLILPMEPAEKDEKELAKQPIPVSKNSHKSIKSIRQ